MLLVVAALGLAGVLSTAFFGLVREEGGGGRSAATPEAVVPAGVPEPRREAPRPMTDASLPESDGVRHAEPMPMEGPLSTVSGTLVCAAPGPFPPRWTLEVRRSGGDASEAPLMSQAFEGVERFELRLPHGDWELRALAPGLASERARAQLDAGRGEARVELRLMATCSLHGRVTDEHGSPLDGVVLSVRGRDGRALESASSDAEGRFAIPSLLPGDYQLLVGGVERPAIPPQPVTLHGQDGFLAPIVLADLGAARVRVLDPRSRPVASARVWGQGEQGGEFEGRTDAQGRLVVRHLPRGPWRAHAQQGGRRSSRVFRVEPGVQAEVEVYLPGGQ